MMLSRYILLILLTLPMLTAQAEDDASNIDPWEPFNRKMYVFNDTLDRWVLKPTARGYKFIMPDFAQQGVTNFITNIYDFNSFFNSIFQGEFSGSANAGGRFLINSTLGLLGVLDVATEMGIEPFHADFGQTLQGCRSRERTGCGQFLGHAMRQSGAGCRERPRRQAAFWRTCEPE